MEHCIYCGEQLVRYEGHPTWKLCPRHDRTLFSVVASPAVNALIDKRGEPSRPGPAK